MSIFDRERNEINERLNKTSEVAPGEYQLLQKLLELLDNNLKGQNGPTEYLDKRDLTGLSKLTTNEREIFMNPVNQRFKEEDAIKKITRSMVSESRLMDITEKDRADDGNFIKKEWLPEYNRLYRMKQILYVQMKSNDYFEYYKLRAETQIGAIGEDQYVALMGRKPPFGEKFPEIGESDISKENIAAAENVPKDEQVIEETLAHDNHEQPPLETPHDELSEPQASGVLQNTPKEKALANLPNNLAKDNHEEVLDNKEQEPIPLQPTGLAKKYNPAGTTDFILVNEKYQYGTGNENPFETPKPDVGDNNEPPQDDLEDLVEVEKITPWKWVKKHKKAILIGLGISALAITTIIFFNQILPALAAKAAAEVAAEGAVTTATKASQIAGLASDMINNGKLWATAATQAEQLGLHSANVSIANTIGNLTGTSAVFSETAGAWTFGSQTLAQFAASTAATAESLSAAATTAIANAATAAAQFTKLTHIGAALGTAGWASFGAGMLIPKDKSKEYHEIKKMIDAYKKDIPSLDKNKRTSRAQEISNKIIASDEISNNERDILLRKLQQAIKKARKTSSKVERVKAEQVTLDADGKYVRPEEDIFSSEYAGKTI